jgi:excisionase family DNA binding protein
MINSVKDKGSLFDNRIEQLLNIEDLSTWLMISEKTLRDWVYKRQIPFKKVGNLIRFVPSEIHRWIEERNVYVDRGS